MLTFQPALLFESPLSLKYGTFCTIHSYIWLSVSLLSGAELIACVIKSAYDKLPQALRRDEFFLDADDVVTDDGVFVWTPAEKGNKNLEYFNWALNEMFSNKISDAFHLTLLKTTTYQNMGFSEET